MLLPQAQWHRTVRPAVGVAPGPGVSTQIHAQRAHHLPPDPAAAYIAVTGAARNLEARSAGAALVGDNLGAALDAARSDAAYAQVLFLFLGLPGAVLAALLTATIASAGSTRRRAEQALLRARGATARQLLGLVGVEAAVVGITGAALGLLARRWSTGARSGRHDSARPSPPPWGGPQRLRSSECWSPPPPCCCPRDAICANTPSPPDARRSSARIAPVWARLGLDGVVLAGAALVFLAATATATSWSWHPKGVPAISVSYWAFAGPALLWLGAALLTWRLADLLLGRGRGCSLGCCARSTGRLGPTIANGMSRQRRPLVRAIVLLALAVAFAASTATFNATYRQQAEVDAQLTNGADVTVTAAPGAVMAPDTAATLAAVPGVRAVEPMQHRFAYIGADLQDLYGVRPATITRATALQDTYFPHATAAALMDTLAAKPDSILVSAETVTDFQLQLGDPVTLRLIDAAHPPTATRSPSTTSGSSPSSPPPPRTASSSPTPATSRRKPAPMRPAPSWSTPAVATPQPSPPASAHVVGTSAAVTDIATVRDSVGRA